MERRPSRGGCEPWWLGARSGWGASCVGVGPKALSVTRGAAFTVFYGFTCASVRSLARASGRSAVGRDRHLQRPGAESGWGRAARQRVDSLCVTHLTYKEEDRPEFVGIPFSFLLIACEIVWRNSRAMAVVLPCSGLGTVERLMPVDRGAHCRRVRRRMRQSR